LPPESSSGFLVIGAGRSLTRKFGKSSEGPYPINVLRHWRTLWFLLGLDLGELGLRCAADLKDPK
jgi:hypothetical protein